MSRPDDGTLAAMSDHHPAVPPVHTSCRPGALVLTAVFVWSFSGGWDGIRPQPHPDDRRVVRARLLAPTSLDRLTAATLPALGATTIAGARTDECQEGQNNWKIHDGSGLDQQTYGGDVDGTYRTRAGELAVEVVAGATPVDPLPTYAATVVAGDADAVRAAVAEPGAVRIVERTTVRYFDD